MTLASLLLISLAASPQLDEGRALVQQLQFAQARAQLEAAKASTTLSLEERREVSSLLAYCFAAEGKLTEAESAYAELLANDPQAPGPVSGPPRLREAFRRAKERLYPPDFASLTREPAPPGRVGVRLLDPWKRCAGVALLTKTAQGEFASEPVTIDAAGRGQADLNASPAWYAEARTGKGERCASLGSALEPLVGVTVEPAVLAEPSSAPRSRAVPWIAFGVSAAAAATTGVFAGLGAGSLEQAKQLTFASDIRAAELSARSQFSIAWGVGIGAALAALTTAALFFTW